MGHHTNGKRLGALQRQLSETGVKYVLLRPTDGAVTVKKGQDILSEFTGTACCLIQAVQGSDIVSWAKFVGWWTKEAAGAPVISNVPISCWLPSTSVNCREHCAAVSQAQVSDIYDRQGTDATTKRQGIEAHHNRQGTEAIINCQQRESPHKQAKNWIAHKNAIHVCSNIRTVTLRIY